MPPIRPRIAIFSEGNEEPGRQQRGVADRVAADGLGGIGRADQEDTEEDQMTV